MKGTAVGSRRGAQGWELRAQVTETSFSFLDRQADALGRPRAWHVGLVVEAFAEVSRSLSPFEQAQLDLLLRRPEELLQLLRRGLSPEK